MASAMSMKFLPLNLLPKQRQYSANHPRQRLRFCVRSSSSGNGVNDTSLLDRPQQEQQQPSQNGHPKEESIQTVAPAAPVTSLRRVDPNSDFENISKPYIPRALQAVDNDHPQGSSDHEDKGMTVLQQHVAFFDRDNNGVVYPWETYEGFRVIGFHPVLAFLGSAIINGSMSLPTQEGFPNLLLPIYVKNIHKAKHGSDSEVYDHEGRFNPANFELMFQKYAKTKKDKMSFDEIITMTAAQKDLNDWFGWLANKLEWWATYHILEDEERYMDKDTIRGIYDGSVFEQIEQRKRQPRRR